MNGESLDFRLFVEKNEKKFRATQIYEYLYKKRIKKIEEMNNIGKNNIEVLKNKFSFYKIKLIKKQINNTINIILNLFFFIQYIH